MPKIAPPGAVAAAARRLERLIAAEQRARPRVLDDKLGAPPEAVVLHVREGESPEALAERRAVALAPFQGAERMPQVVEVRHVTLAYPDPAPEPPALPRPAPTPPRTDLADAALDVESDSDVRQRLAARLGCSPRNVSPADIARYRVEQRLARAEAALAEAERARARAVDPEALLDGGWSPLAARGRGGGA